MSAPNRWLHVRLARGFTAEEFACFRAHCRVWQAYVEVVLANWAYFHKGKPPAYAFFEPELSADRTIATLPVGGEWTLASRSDFEDSHSRLLWQRFPLQFQFAIDEGITERFGETEPYRTNWRKAAGAGTPYVFPLG